jgi:hypothetical protein
LKPLGAPASGLIIEHVIVNIAQEAMPREQGHHFEVSFDVFDGFTQSEKRGGAFV